MPTVARSSPQAVEQGGDADRGGGSGVATEEQQIGGEQDSRGRGRQRRRQRRDAVDVGRGEAARDGFGGAVVRRRSGG
jgi:hypothetical protein